MLLIIVPIVCSSVVYERCNECVCVVKVEVDEKIRLDLKASSVVGVHLARSPVRLSIAIERALNLADNTFLLLLWGGSGSSVDWSGSGASWSSDRSSAGSNARVVDGTARSVEWRWVAPVLLSCAVELLHDGGHG